MAQKTLSAEEPPLALARPARDCPHRPQCQPRRGATYPDRPVKVVVGFAAGGPTDVIARIVCDKFSARFGKQFYVVNQPGAGSNTATGMVAASPPDGYTLLVVSTDFLINPACSPRSPTIPSRILPPSASSRYRPTS